MPFIEHSEYKGNKMIVLKRKQDDKYPFSFGLGKAKLLLQCIKEIQAFVDANDVPFGGNEE